ncbi:10106_t:CDS:2 [Ambispora gerdemannii]|uniref:10106_t:CDS:1 n=1 Tax=Ambispora gerdemannii TaxID=144530 RepID=A0A9N9FXE7_9GLOM|nr:10106_t:CDS:2 [Ambispora gerdemannii]
MNRHQEKAALNIYQRRKTSTDCAYLLGFFYHYGIGFDGKCDYDQAYRLYKYAADDDNSFANIQIGELYQDARDHKAAVGSCRKAAILGHPQGAFKYSLFLSYPKSIYWVQKSAEGGFEAAQCDMVYRYCNGSGVLRDQHRALYWILKSVKNEKFGNIFIFIIHVALVKPDMLG